MADFHVLIVGAGTSGLLLAQGLKKLNIKFTVFEAAAAEESYRLGEWAFSGHWSTAWTKNLLPDALWNRISQALVDPSQPRHADRGDPNVLTVYDASTCQELFVSHMTNHLRYNRAKYRNFLTEDICVQYNKKLVSQTNIGADQITVNFEDGSSATGSLLVGADGPYSKCRELLVGKREAATEPASTPDMPIIITSTHLRNLEPEQALELRRLHHYFYGAAHPDGAGFFVSVLDVPNPDDPRSWVFMIVSYWRAEREPLPGENMLPLLKAWAPKVADPWRSYIELIPDDSHLENQRLSFWKPSPRDNLAGRATLLGDAAHLTGPFRGQGWNHCVADIVSLTSHLQDHVSGKSTIKQAIDAYDADVIKRAREEVYLSHKNLIDLLHWDRLLNSPMAKMGHKPNSGIVELMKKERNVVEAREEAHNVVGLMEEGRNEVEAY